MVRDGFVWKKSRLIHGGSWERRYMRTERHMLAYFSEGLAKIQQSKIKDARAGGYRYRTEGVDPSEELDMREVVQSIDDIVRVGADLHPVDECDAEVSSPGGGARKGTKPAFGYFRVTCHKPGGSTRGVITRMPLAGVGSDLSCGHLSQVMCATSGAHMSPSKVSSSTVADCLIVVS